MKKINVFKRLFSIIAVILITTITISIVIVAFAEESNKENTSSESASTVSELSSSEIDKILEDVKSVSNKNWDDIISKMNDVINRAILTNNDDLKQYAEYIKQMCELQKQLDTINESISVLKAKNSDIASLDKEVQNISKGTSMDADDMQGVISDKGLSLLSDIDMSKVTEDLGNVPGMETVLNDPASATDSQKALVEVILLQSAIDKELLKDDQIDSAKGCINMSLAKLVSGESTKYTSNEYDSLKKSSKEFESYGNKSESIVPSQVVFYNESAKLSVAPIVYDKNILISINDIINFTGASVQYTEGTGNMALIKDKKLIEFTRGSNVAYVNDVNMNTSVPILTFKGITYIPIEFFAKSFDISYISIPDNNVFITYSGLVSNAYGIDINGSK